MADDWYFAKGGRRVGPFTFAQFAQMARSGLLTPDDMVAHGERGMWSSAKCVAGLFAEAGPPPPTEPIAVPASSPAVAAKPERSGGGSSGSSWGQGVAVIAMFGLLLLLRHAGCIPEDVSVFPNERAAERVAREVETANAVAVSAEGLTQELRANEVASNQKYKGKVLEVSGVVGQVRAGGGGPFVQMAGVRCEFKREKDVEKLVAGHVFVIRGKYQGGGVLKYCVLRR